MRSKPIPLALAPQPAQQCHWNRRLGAPHSPLNFALACEVLIAPPSRACLSAPENLQSDGKSSGDVSEEGRPIHPFARRCDAACHSLPSPLGCGPDASPPLAGTPSASTVMSQALLDDIF